MSNNSTNASRHKIRLHGPWHYEPLAFTELTASGESLDLPGSVPSAGTMKIPADWSASLGADFRGRVLYKRRFGRPTNLDVNERVDLVIEQLHGFAIVRVNGEDLGEIKIGDSDSRFELTDRLQPNNELQLEINHPLGSCEGLCGGIPGDVRLEIYEVVT